jgi:hypothetical protein
MNRFKNGKKGDDKEDDRDGERKRRIRKGRGSSSSRLIMLMAGAISRMPLIIQTDVAVAANKRNKSDATVTDTLQLNC